MNKEIYLKKSKQPSKYIASKTRKSVRKVSKTRNDNEF